jgi:DNA polymerase beta
MRSARHPTKTKKATLRKSHTRTHVQYIGGHTSISPSILEGIQYMHGLGANAIQIFAGSNASASLKTKQEVSKTAAQEIRKYIQRFGLYVVIHAIYMLNFCQHGPSSRRIKYMHDNLKYDLELAQRIGARAVVIHMGFHLGLDRQIAHSNLVDNLIHILSETQASAPDVELLLEVSAGAGTQIGVGLAELADIITLLVNRVGTIDTGLLAQCRGTDKGVGTTPDSRRAGSPALDVSLNSREHSPEARVGLELSVNGTKSQLIDRLGVCLDTQHMFSAGIDIRGEGGLDTIIKYFAENMNIGLIRLIHLNDSAVKLGARRDMHAGLGEGHLFGGPDGIAILRNIVLNARKFRIPIILETHGAGTGSGHPPESAKPEHTAYSTEIGILRAISNGEPVSRLVPSRAPSQPKTSKKQRVELKANGGPQSANWPLLAKFRKLRAYYTDIDRDKIRALAYGKALMALQAYPDPILSGQQVAHLPGIGKKIADKIDEFIKTGTMKIFKEQLIDTKLAEWEHQRATRLDSILGFGPVRVRGLAKQGIHTVSKLRSAVHGGKVKLNEMESVGLEYHDDLQKKVPRTETEAIFKQITSLTGIKGLAKREGLQMELAGSYPSGRLESKDIDLLIFTDKFTDPAKIPSGVMRDIQTELQASGMLVATVNIGAGKLMGLVRLDSRHPVRHVDIRLIPKVSEVYGRFYFTSGRDFNQMVRQHAKKMGYRLNEYGLYDLRTGKAVEGLATEEMVMDKIGLGYIPMSKRRG